MLNLLISAILAAGVATFVYSKLGQRVGYGNSGTVWQMTGIAFAVALFVIFTFLQFGIGFGR